VFRPKLEARRQARIYLGLDCRKVVWRRVPDGLGANALVHIAEAVTAARAAWLRSRADFWVLVSSVGCRDR